MRNIIISFLGTGQKKDGAYRTVTYRIGELKKTSEFVVDVLQQKHNAEKIIVIGTVGSMWDELYNKFVGSDIPDALFDIPEQVRNKDYPEIKQMIASTQSELDKAFEDSIISPMVIEYGITEEEQENNMNTMLNIETLLNSGDQVYLDITHGFRSFPVLLRSVINFVLQHSNKKIEVKDISYGMLEAISMLNYAPVVSLSKTLDFDQTVLGAHEFAEYGEARLYSKVLDKSLGSILASFTDNIALNRMEQIVKDYERLKGAKKDKLSNIERIVINKVIDKIGSYLNQKGKEYQQELAITEMMLQFGKTGYALICLSESIASFFGYQMNGAYPIGKKQREEVKKNVEEFAKKNNLKALANVRRTLDALRNSVAHNTEFKGQRIISDYNSFYKTNISQINATQVNKILKDKYIPEIQAFYS